MRRITKLSTGPPLTVGSADIRLGPRSLHLHFIVKYCTKLERVICNLTFLIFFLYWYLCNYWYWFYFTNTKPRNLEIVYDDTNHTATLIVNRGLVNAIGQYYITTLLTILNLMEKTNGCVTDCEKFTIITTTNLIYILNILN